MGSRAQEVEDLSWGHTANVRQIGLDGPTSRMQPIGGEWPELHKSFPDIVPDELKSERS